MADCVKVLATQAWIPAIKGPKVSSQIRKAEDLRRFIVWTQFPENNTLVGSMGKPLGGDRYFTLKASINIVGLYRRKQITQFGE